MCKRLSSNLTRPSARVETSLLDCLEDDVAISFSTTAALSISLIWPLAGPPARKEFRPGEIRLDTDGKPMPVDAWDLSFLDRKDD
jgi:hypothetical protein